MTRSMGSESSNKTTSPLVSVIIPVFNSALYLAKTLDSVVQQSFTDMEIIVVDDCSTDDSRQVVRGFVDRDERVKLIKLNSNSGSPAKPRNVGIEHASGRFLAFLDSDDIWHQRKLEIQLGVMSKHELAFSSTHVRKFVDASASSDQEISTDITSLEFERFGFNDLIRKNIVATSSVIVLRSVVAGFEFSTSEGAYGLEDYKMWLDVLAAGDVRAGLIKFVSGGYRVREGSMSRSKLRMALRVYRFLSVYSHDKRTLGAKKYFYFVTYLLGSLNSKMYR